MELANGTVVDAFNGTVETTFLGFHPVNVSLVLTNATIARRHIVRLDGDIYYFDQTVVSVFVMIIRLCSAYLLMTLNNFIYTTSLVGAQYLYNVPTLAIHLHLLALAANRALAVFFPIWYSSNVRGKFLWKLCIGIWTFVIVYNAFSSFLFLLVFKFKWQHLEFIWQNLSLFEFDKYLSPILVYFSAFLYLLMSAKLIYLKCAKRDISNHSELDHVKISVICMLGMVPFLVEGLSGIIGGIILKYATKIGSLIFNLTIMFSNYFIYITEDLCLLLLCKDFRRMFIPTRCLCLPKPAANAVGGNVVVPAPQMVGK